MRPYPNTKLSVVIPTHNRASFLDFSLATHVPFFKKLGIQIFIFDNASTDNTAEVVEKWMSEYPHISYLRHEENLGAELNFEFALKTPSTDYIWLLGDSYYLPEKSVQYILSLNGEADKHDLIVVNLADKLNLPAKNYTDPQSLLEDLGAMMSCLSCLVYSKSLIAEADFARYRETYFVQTGIVFEFVVRKKFSVHWAGAISIGGLEKAGLKKSSWANSRNLFDIGIEKWANFIFSLPPQYPLSSKLKACVDFGKLTGAFTIKGMISLRAKGVLDLSVYRQFKKYFKFTLGYPACFIGVLVLVPSGLLRVMLTTAKNIFGK